MSQQWGLVVPVKLLALAKTRLSGFGDAARRELALAFALDVVAVAVACGSVGQVLVVTDDHEAAAALGRPGVLVVPDTPDAGLNAALDYGADRLRAADRQRPVASLAADLPALRAQDLTAALREVVDRAFVADSDGIGTTLLAARPPQVLAPAYGAGSRLRHLASGATELVGSPSLRRDVDTPEDLAAALRLGVGAATTQAVFRLGLAPEVFSR